MSGISEYVFPTSFAQRRLWFLNSLRPGSATYNVPNALRIDGPLDAAALSRAFDALLGRHEMLRTVFRLEEGEPVQIVAEQPHPMSRLQVTDLTSHELCDARARAAALAEAEAVEPFDLEHGPVIRTRLLRVGPEEHVLLVTMHHIVTDAWSRGVFFRDLAALYAAERGGTPAELLPLGLQYGDYAVWQRSWMQGEELQEHLAYWREQLRPPIPVTDLPADRPRPAMQGSAGARLEVAIPDETAARFLQLCREEETTLFTAAFAAYAVLLHRHTAQTDILIGTPIAGRQVGEVDGLIGFLVNTLVLRTGVRAEESFRDYLARAQRTVLDAFANQDVPFEKLVEELKPERDPSRNPFFQTMLVVQHVAEGGPELQGVRVSRLPGSDWEAAKFDLTVFLSEKHGKLKLLLEYSTALYDAARVAGWGERLAMLLQSISDNPDTPVGMLRMMTGTERQRIVEWSGRETDYPRDSTIHAQFRQWAVKQPDAPAVVTEAGTLSYGNLHARATRLAGLLRRRGVGPGDRVGVALPRSEDLVVSLLAILETGAAYVPLDPEYPAERLRFMLEDSATPLLLTTRALATSFPARQGTALLILDESAAELAAEPDGAPAGAVGAESPAYVIYTSGSTGIPKGVVARHRGVLRLVINTDYLPPEAFERVLGYAPITFDASTLELWGPLLNGGTLVLAPPRALSLAELGEVIEGQRIKTAWLTAALFHEMVDAQPDALRGLRFLLAGGDVLSPVHVRRFLDGAPGCRLINGYGPTENTTFTCCFSIPPDWPATASVPIGRPIANTRVYVLDEQRNPVPIGVAGELYTGGDGVAIGYLDRPELTDERFVDDPFSEAPGARLYRTGDLVRWRADGTITFVGRMDAQVKVRGFRVEPGEVETALAGHPLVRQAAVIARVASSGHMQLVGYYVRAPGDRDSAAGAPAALRAYLHDRLPNYMVPDVLVPLEALPVGPAGKLDRAALPAPHSVTATEPAGAKFRPRTNVEVQIMHIWEALLESRPIGITQDFFEIGGHSLLAVRMLAELERVSGRKVPLTTLFQESTIERLAALIEDDVFSEGDPPVTVLQAQGTGRPFVFVHGDVHGGGWYSRRLATMLGADIPLIVLPTLRPSAGGPASIKAMAAQHVGELRRIQPHGPYRLGGFCVGGMIAFEMARQLTDSGERVEPLILIDAYATNAAFRVFEPIVNVIARRGPASGELDRRATLMWKLFYYRRRLRIAWRASALDQLQWIWSNIRRRLPFGTRPVSPKPPVHSAAPFAETASRPGMEVVRFQERAAAAYIPGTYPGEIDLIFSINPDKEQVSPEVPPQKTESPKARLSRTRWSDWERVAPRVHPYGVMGPHLDMATHNLTALADRMRAILARTSRPE